LVCFLKTLILSRFIPALTPPPTVLFSNAEEVSLSGDASSRSEGRRELGTTLLSLSALCSLILLLVMCTRRVRRQLPNPAKHLTPASPDNTEAQSLDQVDDQKLNSLMRDMSFDESSWLQAGQTFTIDIPELDFGTSPWANDDLMSTATGRFHARRLDRTYVPSAEGVLYVARVVSEHEARANIDHELYAPVLQDMDPHYERLPESGARSSDTTQGPALPPRRPRNLQLYAVCERERSWW
jgi:hypothetical protein